MFWNRCVLNKENICMLYQLIQLNTGHFFQIPWTIPRFLGHFSSLPTELCLSDSSVLVGVNVGKDIEIESFCVASVWRIMMVETKAIK